MRAAANAAGGMGRALSRTVVESIRAPRRRAAGASNRRGRNARGVAALVALALVGAVPAALPASALAEECPNAAFRTGPSAHLPDCRAYEMVTPPYKDAGFTFPFQFGVNGTTLTTMTDGAYNGVEAYPNVFIPLPEELYTTRRTASGWVSTPDDPSATEYLPFLKNGFVNYAGTGGESAESLSTVWMARGAWQADNRVDFFMREPDRSVVDIGPALPPSTPSGSPNILGDDVAALQPEGFSAGASRFFFTLGGDYWPFDESNPPKLNNAPGARSLYEYVGTGNTTPLLVGVDDSGQQISRCGVSLGGAGSLSHAAASTHNAVSRDGNTVFFTAAPQSAFCTRAAPPVEELFARIDNGLPDAHTVAISEPSKEDCATCDTEAGVLADAYFAGASEDGSKVFFTTPQPLLGGDASMNVYEYDFDAPAGERVIRVSAGDATVANPAAEVVEGLHGGQSPRNSEDGSHVYFIAEGVLTKTPNGEGEAAEQGTDNLYVFERDTRFPNGHIALVARLAPEDLGGEGYGGWSPDMTPDGRFLVFASVRDLTADDTSTARQIFEYDAQTGSLKRVSIGEEGFNHDGNATVMYDFLGAEGKERINDASIASPEYGGGYSPFSYWNGLSVSSDGAYVFFQSAVGLTPQALDQKVIGQTNEGQPLLAENVYEYHDGHVSLISDGEDIHLLSHALSLQAVALLGTDASGADVYFRTLDQLVGQDTDTNSDIYDARIDGGFPGPVARPVCEGEACEGALAAAPTLLSPGSEFQAGGNPPLADEAGPKAMPKSKTKAHAKKPERKKPRRGSRVAHPGRKAVKSTVGGHARVLEVQR